MYFTNKRGRYSLIEPSQKMTRDYTILLDISPVFFLEQQCKHKEYYNEY